MIDLVALVWRWLAGSEIDYAEFGLVGGLVGAFIAWRRKKP